MIRLSFVIVGSVVLYGCGRMTAEDRVVPEKMSRSSKKLTLTLSDTLIMPVDSTTLSQQYYHQLFHSDSGVYYIIVNDTKPSLIFFNVHTGQKAHEIVFQREGPNGIGRPYRFYFHNLDSIFFISYDNHKSLDLFNSAGMRVRNWKINLPEPYSDYWIWGELLYEFSYDPLTKSVGFWIYRGDVSTLSHQKTIKQCRFNIDDNTCKIFGYLPYQFRKVNYYPNSYINSYTSGDYYVTWYLPLHEIHVYDRIECNLTHAIYAKSSFVPEVVEPLRDEEVCDADVEEEGIYNMENSFYVKMFSNESGSLHYRIVKRGVPSRYPDGRMRHFYDRPFVIMLLDENLALIDEIEFPGDAYDFFQSFAVDNRLYMSLNNPLNPVFSDEAMQFAVFEVR